MLSSFVLLAGIVSTAGNKAIAQDAAASCAPVVGRVVSLQGNVEVQRAGTPNWLKVSRLDTSICAGDRLRTDALSRAALFVQPETLVRVDENTTISLSQTTAEVLVEFHTDEVSQTAQNAQSCGAGYFITRFPRKFKVSTPHMNAAVEGTEFMVESSCDATKLTVIEGKVSSESIATQDAQLVTAGRSLESGATGPAAIAAVVKPQDAVQWVLRYPPISDGSNASRAEVLLRAGSVDKALAEIDSVLSGDPDNSDAHALRAIIQVAKNDKSGALESAARATATNAANYRAWLALSYAQQASFNLEAALESSLKAESLQPGSALAHARVAELHLSLGNSRRAEEAARAAVASDPAESHAHSMLGFVHLAQIDTKAARADFEAAIERDSFSALPRLGLGLAVIREGKLVEGREQIEIAVALDPNNSLLRSYVGKAYYEENSSQRNLLAATQFALAQELDPLDPTYSFYDAVLKQSQARPVDALVSLNAAIEKNDNRAIYRSRLFLDDDAAAQGATVAAIYGSLGFERLAVLESTKALSDNPGNHSAHRLLATAYANIPRHDIARVSEALQAQIRQPLSVSPVSALLGTDSLVTLKDAGPSRLGAQEFNQLFNRNQHEITAEALFGSRDTIGGQFVVSGLEDKISYSVTALDYETDGFVANDSAARSIYDLFVHGQIADSASVQVNARHSDLAVGQTFFTGDPNGEPTTVSEVSDSFRVSGNHELRPSSNWIWTAIYEDRRRGLNSFPDDAFLTGNDSETVSFELQNLLRFGEYQLVTGIGYVDEKDEFAEGINVSITTANLYTYGQWRPEGVDLSLLAGLSVDLFELDNSIFPESIEKNPVNAKLGVVWSPLAGTTIRAAAFSSLRRPFVRNQSIEPTQVAGFNQFFTGFEQFFGDPIGTESARIGLALDQTLPRSAFAGIEVAKRRLDIPAFPPTPELAWEELTAQAYIYKTFESRSAFGIQGSVSLDVEFERIERTPLETGIESILELDTLRVPLAVRLFAESGLIARAATTYVKQEGTFLLFAGFPFVPKEDDGWTVDLTFEYRLPNRRGSLAVGAYNIFDEFVDLLETDPLNARVATRRLAFARIVLDF